MFVANAHRTDALIVDGGKFGGHRAWAHTAAAAMAPGDAPLVLYPGLLGHEWNEDVDNGWRPARLQCAVLGFERPTRRPSARPSAHLGTAPHSAQDALLDDRRQRARSAGQRRHVRLGLRHA